MNDTDSDSPPPADGAPFAREFDAVELREAVDGKDHSGWAHTFEPGTAGRVVTVEGEGDSEAFYVEIIRTEGPEFPAPKHRGESLGLLWANAAQLRVTGRDADN